MTKEQVKIIKKAFNEVLKTVDMMGKEYDPKEDKKEFYKLLDSMLENNP